MKPYQARYSKVYLDFKKTLAYTQLLPKVEACENQILSNPRIGQRFQVFAQTQMEDVILEDKKGITYLRGVGLDDLYIYYQILHKPRIVRFLVLDDKPLFL